MGDYEKALADVIELLDNAKANHSGPEALRHWDYELRDQILMLLDAEAKEQDDGS